jgi:hypothetical protein
MFTAAMTETETTPYWLGVGTGQVAFAFDDPTGARHNFSAHRCLHLINGSILQERSMIRPAE